MGKPISLEQRYWRHAITIPFHECWEWDGALDSKGYGQMQIDHISRKKTGAHRISWMIHYGEIPEGLVVRHKCDNPICSRPEHLELGTQYDNVQDMLSRGRWSNWCSRVTHCPQGHEYNEENTGFHKKKNGPPSRRCKTCDREAARLYRQKKKR